ncbi:hypothetical protein SYNPS1DRAFT_25824 [Syncephalis pseudoplumigaleata]|uniref:Uncharacterized protein n=1 Tax=Syncephalis pseudoplumigaleata TaxID=1712513 RepID=A0A4P9YRC9_9FUNG|nr:hypothetical protein SYNPS1DRAFT_25824 [Syncephalis pseudoplumigaleata]|eukprot:RKP22433.1 hypothetical protein SYNPS1DRAFT_25824 [Syncephalis pseudoplumigaleata]
MCDTTIYKSICFGHMAMKRGASTMLRAEQQAAGKLVLDTAFHHAFASNVPPLILALMAAALCKVTYGAKAMRQQARAEHRAREGSGTSSSTASNTADEQV